MSTPALDDPSTNWRGPWSADEQQALNDAIVIDNNYQVCRLVEASGVCTISPCNCDFWRHAGPVPVAEVAGVSSEESVADEETPPTKNTAELDAQEAAAEEEAPVSVTDAPPVQSKTFCGPWSADVQQHVNDVILIDGSYYICRQVETSGFCTIPPCNCDFWTQSGPAPSSSVAPLNDPTTLWRGAWSADTQQALNDAIVIDNNYYVCRLVEASGVCTIPPSNCDFWRHAGPVPTGAEETKPCEVTPLENPETSWRGYWDQYAKYSVNDAVVHDNTYFVCRQTGADGFCTEIPANIDYWTSAGAVSVADVPASVTDVPAAENTSVEAPAESTETSASVDASATSDTVTEPAKPKSFEEMIAEKLYPPGTVMKDASGNDFVIQPGDKVTIAPGSFKLNMEGCKLQ